MDIFTLPFVTDRRRNGQPECRTYRAAISQLKIMIKVAHDLQTNIFNFIELSFISPALVNHNIIGMNAFNFCNNNLVIHIITYSIQDKLHHRCFCVVRVFRNLRLIPSVFLDRKLQYEKNPKTVFTIWKNGKLYRLCFFLFSLTVIVTEILAFLSPLYFIRHPLYSIEYLERSLVFG